MKPRFEHPSTAPDTTFRSFTSSTNGTKRFDFGWHFHTEYELTLVLASTGTRHVGSSIERYRPGDLVLLGPDLPHSYVSDPDDVADAVVIQFRRDFLGAGFFDLPQFGAVSELLARAALGLRFVAPPQEVTQTLKALPAESPAHRTVSLLTVLIGLAADPAQTTITAPGYAPAPASATRDRIDTVCEYLQLHHTEAVTQIDIAHLAHMSPTSFSRFFHHAMGATFTDYVTQLRVESACTWLAETSAPVADVAQRSGFQNLSSFNRRFRELKQMSPTEFRRSSQLRM